MLRSRRGLSLLPKAARAIRHGIRGYIQTLVHCVQRPGGLTSVALYSLLDTEGNPVGGFQLEAAGVDCGHSVCLGIGPARMHV